MDQPVTMAVVDQFVIMAVVDQPVTMAVVDQFKTMVVVDQPVTIVVRATWPTMTKLTAVTQTGGPQWDEGAAQLSFGNIETRTS